MIAVQLPSGRRVTVATDDPKAAAAAARKFVASDPYESARSQVKARPAVGGAAGAVETAVRAVPFLSEVQAGLSTPIEMGLGALQGHPISVGQAWDKARANQQGWVDSFHDNHPLAANLTKGTAMAAPIAAAILSGGATAAPTVAEDAPGVVKGVADLLRPVVTRTARRATTGAGAGYAYGASQPGTLKERLKTGQQGAEAGAVIGTVAPPVLGAVAKGVGGAAQTVARTVTRAANKAAGGALLDANQVASQRLVESLKADGATPDLIKAALNGFLKNGAADPSLIDLAARLPSGGPNTLALVRAAAAKGSARGVADDYAGQVAADLQGNAINRTRALTPDTRPANVVKDKAVAQRDETATKEYRGPYGTPVNAEPIVPAIEGDAGRVGIAAAYKDADALRLQDEMTELGKLRSAATAEPAPTPVATIGGDVVSSPALDAQIRAKLGLDATPGDTSIPVRLGTLDRVKIALNDAGQAALAKGQNSRAAGFFGRAKEIDDHLADQSREYATARNNYAKASAGIGALDHGATGVTAVPDDYAANLHDFLTKGGPDAGKMAAIGYRQALTDAIGAPTEAATGSLNRVSTSTNQGRNLETTFGPEGAQAYRDGLKDLIDQLKNARFINPNTGSQTAGRLADLGLVEPKDIEAPKLNPLSIVTGAINKIRAGATLTDAERALIAQIGTSKADLGSIDLSDQLKLPPPAGLDDLQALTFGAGSGAGQRRASNQ